MTPYIYLDLPFTLLCEGERHLHLKLLVKFKEENRGNYEGERALTNTKHVESI